MGALTPKEYLQKHDMLVVAPALSISTDTLDSALQQKQSQIVTVIKQYSWKMVFAKSDTVYASLFKEMTEKPRVLVMQMLLNSM